MQTIRREIVTLLQGQEMGARELSQALGISEKEVYGHLNHIARSVNAHGGKLKVQPSRCRQCGFVFTDRQRLTRPGRCPRCKEGHLEAPRFRIMVGSSGAPVLPEGEA
ncbi:MAG TPA: transcriptional regulator [Syntrophobacteraceae bacterium]|jgi:transcriptional regulator|nr:transcriptional regulator [Syntrophobacteraceae bacterium]HBZ56119.1 transcriptional regulator [Syntrophobacteraceae bacterium]